MRNLSKHPVTREEKLRVIEKLYSEWVADAAQNTRFGDITGVVLAAIRRDYELEQSAEAIFDDARIRLGYQNTDMQKAAYECGVEAIRGMLADRKENND